MRILFSRGSGSTRALLPSLQALHGAAAASFSTGHQTIMTVSDTNHHHHVWRRNIRRKENVVVIMGATGTGKSKLSIDLAARFPSEVVNSDKIQVYRGLDITTNKIPFPDRRGVPHHLLGEVDPAAGELPPSAFRSIAASAIAGIAARGRLPVVAGGSNSFIYALVSDRYDHRSDPFVGRHRFRYRCCFLWVDVEKEALAEHLDQRVEEMVGSGMVDELEEYFMAEGPGVVERHAGLGKAIGVPEFMAYFRKGKGPAAYEEAVRAIKENTRRLAEAQVMKIKRLGECGWALHRVDATEVVRARLSGAGPAAEGAAWERDVVGPTLEVVEQFLGDGMSRQLLPLC